MTFLSSSDLLDIKKRELKFKELGSKTNVGKDSNNLIIKKHKNELFYNTRCNLDNLNLNKNNYLLKTKENINKIGLIVNNIEEMVKLI